MPITRTVVYDFEGGAVGAPFTPNGAMHGGSDRVYISTGGQPVYSGTAFSGSRSLHFPDDPPGSDQFYSWYGDPNTGAKVAGIEVTFKTAPSSGSGQISMDVVVRVGSNNGGSGNGLSLSFNETGCTFASAFSDSDGPAGPTSIALDMSAWFTIKVLPTGEWSFSYAGGATILSGQADGPVQPWSSAGDVFASRATVQTYWAGPYNAPGAVSPLWLDDVAFWVYSAVTEPEPVVPVPEYPAIAGAAGLARRAFL